MKNLYNKVKETLKMIKNFKKWFPAALIRAVKTFAQTFLATIGGGAIFLSDVSWGMVLSSASLAAILSIATSVAGLPEVKGEEKLIEKDE
jgi:hypothetical protein